MAERLTVTPSGYRILFEDGEADENGKSKKRCYLVNDEKLPSVSGIIAMVDKSEGLKYWAERLGVLGAIELAQSGGLPVDVDAALGRMTKLQLRHWQVAAQKAERGKLSHEEVVAFGRGEVPRPFEQIPEDQRGFARGLAAFLSDYRPRIVDSELMVASVRYGYAGRLDLRAELTAATQPNGKPMPPGLGLIDYKTHEKLPRNKPTKACPDGPVKTPYAEHLMQVALYELAARESGYGETEWQAIVRVDASGAYDFTVSWIDPDQVVALLPAFALWKACSPRVKQVGHTLPVGLGSGVAA